MKGYTVILFLGTILLAGFGGYMAALTLVEHSYATSGVTSGVAVDSHTFNDHKRTNFPARALKPKDLNFCDTRGGVLRLKYSWKCDGDPTCETCYSDPVWAKMMAVKVTPPEIPNRKSVVVSAVNWGQMYLVINWLCSCRANEVEDPRVYTVMVPTDEKSATYLRDTLGFQVVDSYLQFGIDSAYNGGANIRGHSSINNAVLMVGLAVMNKYRQTNVLIHDVDQAWINGGPLGYLERIAGSGMVDMLGMESPYDTSKGGFNTGFLYFVNNEYSRRFMETLVNLSKIKDGSDQAMINSLIRHRRFTHSFMVAPLPTELFVREGGSRGPRVDPGVSLVYHAVSIKKNEKLALNGQWYFNRTKCPSLYDENIRVVTEVNYI